MINLLEDAKDGDNKSLELLHLSEGYFYKSPAPFDPESSKKEMKADLCDLAYFAAALNKCQLPHCEKIVRKALSYELYVHEILFDKKSKTLDTLNGQDIAEETLEIVRDICATTDMLVEVNGNELKRLNQDTEEGSDVEIADNAEIGSKDRKDNEDGKDSKDGSDEDEEESEGEDVKEEVSQVKKQTTASHHLNRKCLVGKGCSGYFGPNLARHLANVHLKKNHISEQDVERYFQMGVDAKKKTGPPRKTTKGKPMKGRWKRWCPQPNCSYLGAYLPEHLQNKHCMKPSSATYKTSLMIARRYKGMQEELESMVEPEPPIWEVSLPAPPSPPSKRAMLTDHDSDVGPSKCKKKKLKPLDLDSDSDNSIVPPTAVKRPRSSSTKPTSAALTSAFTASGDDNYDLDMYPTAAALSSKKQTSVAVSSSESDDEDPYPMQVDYFTEDNPTTKRHIWLVAYYKYLLTPAAGFHQDKNRLQHACQVKTILHDIDPSGDDIAVLAEEEGNLVWVEWVIPNLKKKAAGTLKPYLTSLQKFLEYVTKKGARPHLPDIDEETKNMLYDLAVNLKGWRHYITKETSSDKWDKYLNECDTLLTSKEVNQIMNLQPAVQGRQALIAADSAKSSDTLTIKQYGAARDLLIVSLTRAVGTRPGPLENATLSMFEKARWDDKKRKQVMLVTSHKREEDGPAPIPMDPDTIYLMQIFIKKLRPLVTDDKSPNSKIFLKSDGAPYHKGTIGRRISAFIVKSGIRSDKPISATDFQKWIVTELKRKKRLGKPIDEDLLRRLLCHSDKTAKQWYVRESLTEQAAEASEQIALHTQATPTKKQSPEKKRSPTKKQIPNVSDADSDADDESDKVPSSKMSLTTEELHSVQKVFRDDVIERISPRKKRVVFLMKTDLVLRKVVNSDVKVKKVIDRVRHLVNSQPTLNPQESPLERTAKYVLSAPSTSGLHSIQSGQVEWSEEETAAIEEALKGYDKVPRNTEIISLMSSTQELQAIYKENTFDRIRNNVKNIFQKRKRK